MPEFKETKKQLELWGSLILDASGNACILQALDSFSRSRSKGGPAQQSFDGCKAQRPMAAQRTTGSGNLACIEYPMVH